MTCEIELDVAEEKVAKTYRFHRDIVDRVERLVETMKAHPETRRLRPTTTAVVEMMIEHALPDFEEKYKLDD